MLVVSAVGVPSPILDERGLRACAYPNLIRLRAEGRRGLRSGAHREDSSFPRKGSTTWLTIPSRGAHGSPVRFVDLGLGRLVCRVVFRCGVVRLGRVRQFLAEALLRSGVNRLLAVAPITDFGHVLANPLPRRRLALVLCGCARPRFCHFKVGSPFVTHFQNPLCYRIFMFSEACD